MTIYQWISGIPFLSQLNKCIIDRTITMWMIFTHSITNDTSTLTMWLIWSVVQLDHRIQNSSLNWLQTISYIWKCSGSNYRHGIVYIGVLHCFLKIYLFDIVMSLIKNVLVRHFLSPFLGFFAIKRICYISKFFTNLAFSSINFLRGSTLSPIRTLNVRSTSDSSSPSIDTLRSILFSGSIVVSHS